VTIYHDKLQISIQPNQSIAKSVRIDRVRYLRIGKGKYRCTRL
jgi:hypothetical protein